MDSGMDKTNLIEIPNKPNQSAIEMIEELLVRVKSGQIIGVSICTVNRGGESHEAWSGGDYPTYIMLGAIEVLKRDYMAKEIE